MKRLTIATTCLLAACGTTVGSHSPERGVGAFGRTAVRLLADYLHLRHDLTGEVPLVIVCAPVQADWSRVTLQRPATGIRVAREVQSDAQCRFDIQAELVDTPILLIREILLREDTSRVLAEVHRRRHPRGWEEEYLWTAEPVPGDAHLVFRRFAGVD